MIKKFYCKKYALPKGGVYLLRQLIVRQTAHKKRIALLAFSAIPDPFPIFRIL